MVDEQALRHVIVIGAGVVGLSTAIRIQEKSGYSVTIVAETFPTDPKSIRYTSHWAGAHHVSHAGDDYRQQKIDRETFETFWELSAPGGSAEGIFLRHTQTEYRGDDIGTPTWLEYYPEFRQLPESELLPGAKVAFALNTVTINVPLYLNWLLSRFLANGGKLVRGSLQHISQVIEGGASIFTGAKLQSPLHGVVACVGLGARTLGGIEDKSVHPIRGQTVLLKAPWLKYGRSMTAADGTYTYVMPRRDGTVLIGGTRVPNDWYPLPRPEITDDILVRALTLMPDLAPPHVRDSRTATVDDLLPIIIEEGCGLRPGRTNGVRFEVEWFDRRQGGKIPVVYNYGHAGFGFQSSWGSATVALELLEQALGPFAPWNQ